MHAALDVVGAEARADGALLDDVERRSQRTGTQQQREFTRLVGHHARDLEVAAEHAADRGLVDDLLLGAFVAGARALAGLAFGHALLLDEHDRHRTAEVLARRLEHLRRAARVERDHDRGLALLEAGAGIRQLLTRDDRLALEQHRPAIARVVELRAERRALGADRPCNGVVLVVHEPELEGGRRAEHAQRFVGILHAGQLHDDAVEALAGDDRLGDAEFVDAIAQRGDVLLDREVLPLLDLRRAQPDRDGTALAERVGVDATGSGPACAAGSRTSRASSPLRRPILTVSTPSLATPVNGMRSLRSIVR